MELPRHVHRYGGAYLIVRTQDELDAALASGWHLLPPQTPPEASGVVTVSEETAPAVAEDAAPVKRKPGRPRKVQG